MGEISEYMIDRMIWEELNYRDWSGEVHDYTSRFTFKELMLEAKEVLAESRAAVSIDQANKVTSIITFGIVHQRLTDKQIYALGDFILTHS
jgi:hypothetical protein